MKILIVLIIAFQAYEASASNSNRMTSDQIKEASKIQCMMLVVSSYKALSRNEKIYELAKAETRETKKQVASQVIKKIKKKYLFHNQGLHDNISREIASVELKNKTQQLDPERAVKNMVFANKKIERKVSGVDKTFYSDCEKYFSTAYNTCSAVMGTRSTGDSCLKGELNKNIKGMSDLLGRIL